jgi:hypothetical protein
MATVQRFVISHIGKNVLRRLTFAQQGRYTYGTADAARHALREYHGNDGLSHVLTSEELATLEVRAVACYAGHHDPVGYYLDKFTTMSGSIYRDGVVFVSVQLEDFDNRGNRSASPVEVDALRNWICERLNDPGFNLANIVCEHRGK